MDSDRYGRLTDKQCECLDRIGAGFSEKEIARQLEITPYAVKERLRAARKTLDIADSRVAARGLRMWRETIAAHGRVGLACDSVDIAYTRDVGSHESLAGQEDYRLSDGAAGPAAGRRPGYVAQELREEHVRYTIDVAAEDSTIWSQLFPRVGRRRNDLTAPRRISLIAIQFALVALALAVLLTAIMAASGYLSWLSKHGG